MATLLAVTAHPDDEVFLFGGVLSLHAQRGDDVALFCLTDGQAGRTGGLVDRAELGAFRREELRRACRVLGIGEPRCAGLEDGGLASIPDEEGTKLVRGVIEELDADVVLTFGPDGASGHPDHKAAWRWASAAGSERIVYAATFPAGLKRDERAGEPLPITTVVDVRAIGDAKHRAFAEHRSQADHQALFDRLMNVFDGTEPYHRVHPAWQEGAPRESELLLRR